MRNTGNAPKEAGAVQDWPARARALCPLIAGAAPRIEAERELPAEVLDALHEAGLFRLLIPRELGGAEADPMCFVEVIEAIATADASTAWCLGQGLGCAMSAAYLTRAAAERVFGNARAVLAWGAGVNGAARRAPGGWRMTGRWMFASGSRHATWLGGQCPLQEADGTPVADADGTPLIRTFLFPRDAAMISDTWHVIGLRGTGSDTYAVSDLLVPDALCFARDRPAPHPGTLYRLPLTHIYAPGFAGVALGIARAALDAFVALAQDKRPRGIAASLRESTAIQSALGKMEMRLRAARALLFATLEEVWRDLCAGGKLTVDHEAAIRGASTFATHEASAVVDFAYHEAGASAIFERNPFERRFRDIHAVKQQIQARRANFEPVGRYLLGLPTGPLFV